MALSLKGSGHLPGTFPPFLPCMSRLGNSHILFFQKCLFGDIHLFCVQKMGTLYTFSEEFSSVLCIKDAAASLCVLEAPFGLKCDIFH